MLRAQANEEIVKQSESIKQILILMMEEDPFSQYCIDCKTACADHGLITYGAFICSSCAQTHRSLISPEVEVIKSIQNDLWTQEDLDHFVPENGGGNKNLYDYMKHYSFENENIKKKYKSYIAQYYAKRLLCKIQKRTCFDPYPKMDYSDNAHYYANRVDQKVNKIGNQIQKKWDQSGIEDKFKNFFKKWNAPYNL